VLLEPGELILRGELRKRLPLNEVKNVKVVSDRLCFTAGGERVQLLLGPSAAQKWAKAIAAGSPSLASKLGITDRTTVGTMGNIEDDALKSALDEAKRISAKDAGLIVACVDTPESLETTLRAAKPKLMKDVPMWIVYAKGPGHPLNEAGIRSLLREQGMMDTKMASVSAKLTALRFNLRKPEKQPQRI
jgi:hypothetical protein